MALSNPALWAAVSAGQIVDTSERKPLSTTVGLPKHLWQQDAEAPTCSMMMCGKEFHRFFQKKHHCRMCGRVVCDGCSSGRRSVLPEKVSAKSLDVRVCDACCHSANLYTTSRTIRPSTPLRSGTMSAPTTPLVRRDPAEKGPATSPWGYAADLSRSRSETSLSAPRAIPSSRDVWHPLPDVAKEPPPGGGGDGEAADAVYKAASYYEGLLRYEPKALDVLMQCAADRMRSLEM
jgi:hypothetical protein